MKTQWIVNGKIQLIISPTNDMEKELLEKLATTPVEITLHKTLQVGEESVNDSVVIKPAKQ